jgi:hypothetical protein
VGHLNCTNEAGRLQQLQQPSMKVSSYIMPCRSSSYHSVAFSLIWKLLSWTMRAVALLQFQAAVALLQFQAAVALLQFQAAVALLQF